jgi:hypothetical protein
VVLLPVKSKPGDATVDAGKQGAARMVSLRHDERVITQRSSSILQAVGCVLLLVTGAVLLWLPFHTFGMLDDWAAELRATGVPAQATVYDRVTKKGGNRESSSTTMYLWFQVGGRTYREEVGCFQVCRSAGEQVAVWANPADPDDFVTDFDQLSGHRGRLQGGLGVVGFTILALGIPTMMVRLGRRSRRRRPAAPVSTGGFTGRSKHKRIGRR